MNYVIEPSETPCVPVLGGGRFPVRRIFCIGKNYAAHVREMGGDPKADPPVFFTKPADAVVESGATIPYPPGTENLHYEGELVAALGAGARALCDAKAADALIFGYAAGCDLTRRDLQAAARASGSPWDTAKAFDHSAPVGAITPVADAGIGPETHLRTSVNGEVRQEAGLSDMIWSVPEIILALSQLFELKAGDLIFTGTPEGVGALKPGDSVAVKIGALAPLDFSIVHG